MPSEKPRTHNMHSPLPLPVMSETSETAPLRPVQAKQDVTGRLKDVLHLLLTDDFDREPEMPGGSAGGRTPKESALWRRDEFILSPPCEKKRRAMDELAIRVQSASPSPSPVSGAPSPRTPVSRPPSRVGKKQPSKTGATRTSLPHGVLIREQKETDAEKPDVPPLSKCDTDAEYIIKYVDDDGSPIPDELCELLH